MSVGEKKGLHLYIHIHIYGNMVTGVIKVFFVAVFHANVDQFWG